MRLDLFLVKNNLASSRTQAQDFIENGYVYLIKDQQQIKLLKTSFKVEDHFKENIRVEPNQLQKYVSRAGLKLESALKQLNLNIKNKIVLDVGQSTGGFTDCLFQHEAARIVGVDVGCQQLHPSLMNNKNIYSIENLNVKELATHPEFLSLVPPEKFDLVVMDISFISITKVMMFLKAYLKVEGEYLFLVKPQFECGKSFLDKNGIVKEPKVYKTIEENIKKAAIEVFNNVEAYIKSDIAGKDGNQEYFIYGKNRI